MDDTQLQNLLKDDNERLMAQAQMRQGAAWMRTKDAMFGGAEVAEARGFAWAGWATAFAVAVAMVVYMGPFGGGNSSLTMANSHQPGLYASTFYSDKAQADVVWISGMEVSTDDEVVQ